MTGAENRPHEPTTATPGAGAKPGRTRRILTIAVIAAGATLIGSLLVADIIGSSAGCGAVDPTDPANYSTARVINDTTHWVIIGDCRGSYCGPQPSATLAPNEHAIVNGACGTTGKNMTTWKLTDAAGHLLGYIDIDTPRSTRDLTFKVTQASADRLTPTKPH